MSTGRGRNGRKPGPPRKVYRTLWKLHRAGYALSGGRLGLRAGSDDGLGTLRLRTVGRRSGQQRCAMLFYLPVGQGFSVVASNAGATYAPAWWLNLQATPAAAVDLPGRTVQVQAREAAADERSRLWDRFVERRADYERYAETAERVIPVVILDPLDEEAHA